ncbi:MAG: zinc-binding dehydrogenase [Actinobacteria bacterium]|nr:zinc-binding dehydrogenase [Actinomycetota bacterium]
MKAMVVHSWGDLDGLRLEVVPDPEPGPDEAIVELRASSLNWHDVLVRRDGRGLPLPSILGIDGAGVRQDTGEEVVIYPGLDWGGAADAPAAGFKILGDQSDGTHAELVAVPSQNLFPKPRHLSWEESAALPTAWLTAYRALFTRGALGVGDQVVVLGAGGGVSNAAVQLGVAAGAEVIVTSSSAAKVARSRDLGATAGVLYTRDGWSAEVVHLTSGGADLVLDGVGGNLEASLRCLRPGGRLVVFGASGGTRTALDVPSFYFSHTSILATTLGSPDDFRLMLEMVDSEGLRPTIDSVRPLAELRAAYVRLEGGEHFGKLVITY